MKSNYEINQDKDQLDKANYIDFDKSFMVAIENYIAL